MNVRSLTLALALATLPALDLGAQAAPRWYRGNTHAHTRNSDGDSAPDSVVRWYRAHGYHFTFITDHEFITDVAPLNAAFGAPGQFLAISAQEITQRTRDSSHVDTVRQAHVNALGVTAVIRPLGPQNIANQSIASTYARNIAEIRKAGGVPQVNHPNFRWSVRVADMASLPDSILFEVWNGHPFVNNLGGADSAGRWVPSHEAAWDSLLTRGKTIWGVADDDSHSFTAEEADVVDAARPGRGWVMVRADTLSPSAILSALRRGDFYASTGVTLTAYAASAKEIALEI